MVMGELVWVVLGEKDWSELWALVACRLHVGDPSRKLTLTGKEPSDEAKRETGGGAREAMVWCVPVEQHYENVCGVSVRQVGVCVCRGMYV